jgi:hypothetical protein
VYGIPGSYFTGDPARWREPLKNLAVLRREGKKDVKPASVEVFQRADGLAVVYTFPAPTEISRTDEHIEFDAQIGRFVLTQSFDLKEMIFQGKVEV